MSGFSRKGGAVAVMVSTASNAALEIRTAQALQERLEIPFDVSLFTFDDSYLELRFETTRGWR
jgi:hypothetical protein